MVLFDLLCYVCTLKYFPPSYFPTFTSASPSFHRNYGESETCNRILIPLNQYIILHQGTVSERELDLKVTAAH